MKYTAGGVAGKTGVDFALEVSVAGTPRAKKAPPPLKVDGHGTGVDVPPPSGDDEKHATGLDIPEKKEPDKKPEPKPDPPKERPEYPLLPEDLKSKYLKMSFTVDGEEVTTSLAHLKYQNLGINKNFKEAN